MRSVIKKENKKPALVDVKKFVEKYTLEQSATARDEMLAGIIKTSYVPYLAKTTLASSMVEAGAKSANGVPVLSTCVSHLNFVMGTLLLYTKLQLTKEKNFDNYDLIKSSGILDKLADKIPASEIEEWEFVWNSTVSDFEKNALNPYRFAADQVHRFSVLVSGVCAPVLTTLATAIDGIDISKVKDTVESIKNNMKKTGES